MFLCIHCAQDIYMIRFNHRRHLVSFQCSTSGTLRQITFWRFKTDPLNVLLWSHCGPPGADRLEVYIHKRLVKDIHASGSQLDIWQMFHRDVGLTSVRRVVAQWLSFSFLLWLYLSGPLRHSNSNSGKRQISLNVQPNPWKMRKSASAYKEVVMQWDCQMFICKNVFKGLAFVFLYRL